MKSGFDYNTFPYSFIHCLNEQCLRCKDCLRRQMGLHIPAERGSVTVVNPSGIAPTGENCRYFLSDQPQQYARGISHLLDRLPHNDAVSIKQQMVGYFGKTTYYRCYRKERLIKPCEQEYIRKIFRNRGLTEAPVFDEYVEYYNLDMDK